MAIKRKQQNPITLPVIKQYKAHWGSQEKLPTIGAIDRKKPKFTNRH